MLDKLGLILWLAIFLLCGGLVCITSIRGYLRSLNRQYQVNGTVVGHVDCEGYMFKPDEEIDCPVSPIWEYTFRDHTYQWYRKEWSESYQAPPRGITDTLYIDPSNPSDASDEPPTFRGYLPTFMFGLIFIIFPTSMFFLFWTFM